LHLTFAPPPRLGGALAQLGEPRGWRDERPPADRLRELVARAAERARAIALDARSDDDGAVAMKSADRDRPERASFSVAGDENDGGRVHRR
jgi:hypothetical protein